MSARRAAGEGSEGGAPPFAPHPLALEFLRGVRASGRLSPGDGVVVALSGGADSVVLLHLLRFTPGLPPLALSAVHVDHGMRAGSEADALWVAGLCRAWGVPLDTRRLRPAPVGEAEARRLRYAVLEDVRRERGARWVVTAHHADDQAETVLFRALRGAGPGGLQGIREVRAPGVWRPLLGLGRKALRAYARDHRVTWREDETNALPFARNVLRHAILPRLEEVVPGAARALSGLASRAHRDAEAWRAVEDLALREAGVREDPHGWSADASSLAALPAPLRARVLRSVAGRLGVVLGEAGTRRAVEFTSAGRSGRRVPLGGGLVLRRELDRVRVDAGSAPPPDEPATLPGPAPGEARARVGGKLFRVRWSSGDGEEAGRERFSARGVRFPLVVRGWLPGDRIRTAAGSKKLKKVFLEARVPPSDRAATPVLVDADGTVLWVHGVVRAEAARPGDEDDVITIGIMHADSD